MVASVAARLEKPISIIRVDGGYFSADTLDWTIEKGCQIVTAERYKWIMFQKPKIYPDEWIEYNSDTKLYDLGRIILTMTKTVDSP